MQRRSLSSRINALEEKAGESSFIVVEVKAGTPAERIHAFLDANVPGYREQPEARKMLVIIQRFGETDEEGLKLVHHWRR